MSLGPGIGELMPGNDAGWLLTFLNERSQGGKLVLDESEPVLEIGRDEYYADIRATLPGGLEGGVYSFTIEGLSDEDYAKIAGGRARAVKLYLYWRETLGGIAGFMSSLAGLTDQPGMVKSAQIPDAIVATLRIESVTRKAGGRKYETTIAARERAFDVVAQTPLCTAINKPAEQAVKELLGTHCGFDDYTWWGSTPNPSCPPTVAPSATPANVVLEQGRTVLELLGRVGGAMEESSGRYGRGMFLIRDGHLHVGARPIPLVPGTPPTELGPEGGLVEVVALPTVATDPTFDVCQGLRTGRTAPGRRQFQLTLKGRPDLKPGDMVRFDAPSEESAPGGASAIGSIGGPLAGSLVPQLGAPNFVQAYVSAVEHRLGRTSGFTTTVTALEVVAQDHWDCHTTPTRNGGSADAASSSPETQVGKAVRDAIREVVDSYGWPEVGEAREMTTTGSQEPPSQTVTLWRGLQPGDGEPNQSRRRPIARPSPSPANDVAYTTPFAWGKCGLVLPRYPGTRVLVSHRKGLKDEAIDVGALWGPDQRPESQAGDWWLILPVGAPTTPPTDEKTAPSEHTGHVVQDLIDAKGNRYLEVGELTIRVGPDKLKDAGQRPDDPQDRKGLIIEHPKTGSKIQIKDDGTIVIEAAKKLELTGKDGVSISAPQKTVTIDASDVNVTVSNAMDVS
jgi:hypothetical protein